MELTTANVPPDANLGDVIELLRQFPQDLPVSKDQGASLISDIAVIAADYGQMVDIS